MPVFIIILLVVYVLPVVLLFAYEDHQKAKKYRAQGLTYAEGEAKEREEAEKRRREHAKMVARGAAYRAKQDELFRAILDADILPYREANLAVYHPDLYNQYVEQYNSAAGAASAAGVDFQPPPLPDYSPASVDYPTEAGVPWGTYCDPAPMPFDPFPPQPGPFNY